jgi:multiple RNA-binding domain-containing protein 1
LVSGVGGTHLYGRRLVVEYAQEDGNIEDLRAKTASKFRDQEDEALLAAGPPSKRSRKVL